MSPMTAAEKQKKYRDKLKNENPLKYEEIQKKAKERSARYYAKKKSTYTEEHKQELRQKWKEDRKKAKDAKLASQNEPEMAQTSNSKQDNIQMNYRNMQRRIEYKLKQETTQLRLQLNTLTKGFKGLQKKMIRQQNKMDKMQADYENVLTRLVTAEETKDRYTLQLEEKTPRKEVTEFINNNIPNIETPKKEEVKKKLLEYDVLKNSLKLQFQVANNTEKNVLRKVLDNDTVKKYKLKTRLRTSLGFKSNFKSYRQRKTKTTALQKKIECFFNRDDVSRATAGKKEYRTFKKVKRQKRYLLDKLIVLHRKFIAEEAPISFSTFKKYRPFYVLAPKIKDCESCACKKHCNMQFLVDTLKSLNILKTDNLNEVTKDLVCDFYAKDCMYNNCNTCSEIKLEVDNEELSTKASWFTWVLKDHEYEKQGEIKKIKKMIKIKKEGTLQDLLEVFSAEMKQFKTHIFNFYYQLKNYKDCINNLKSDEACIHIDFSENFTCKYHKEIQAMHFIKDQITLHTGVIYIKGDKKPISFCSISADNQHNPEAIWAHLDPVLQHIKINCPNIFTIHFFSDGPTTQYRQKKNFYLFSEKVYEYGYRYCTWSFFEAAHGKGAADGIGAVIKRTLDAKIAQGIDIPNAKIAFDILKSEDTSIKVFYISSLNIKPLGTKLSPLKKTMKIHQLITMEKLKLKYRDLSCFCGDPRGSCECHSPVSHSFLPTIDTNETQLNRKKYLKKRNKTLQRRISSSTEEDEYDDNIEYAESDASVFSFDGSISPDFNDDVNNSITELDEQTGVFRSKIDPNKKVKLLSTLLIKKPYAENYTKEDRKRKMICESKDLMHKRLRETTKYVTGKDDVTILSQIRKKPENTASYDLRNSNLFGKEVPIKEIRSDDCYKIMTDMKIDENKENIRNTKEDIKNTLKGEFVIEEKQKIEIVGTKIDETTKNLIIIEGEERNETDESIIKHTRTKQHESTRGQNNTGEDLQDVNKCKEMYQTDSYETNKSETLKEDENKENIKNTKEDIKKILKGKFVIEEKHKIEIVGTKINETTENLNIIEGEERNETDESIIKHTRTKQHESMRGQDNTGEDLQDVNKCKEMDQTDSNETNKSENLKEDEETKKTIGSEEDTQNFILNLNDSIIVRYYQRKMWKYFVGFIENIEFKNGENHYKVKFLKTVKESSDSVKFVVQKKIDIDIVTNISIVKKVNLNKREEASKEFYLSTDFDMVYFY